MLAVILTASALLSRRIQATSTIGTEHASIRFLKQPFLTIPLFVSWTSASKTTKIKRRMSEQGENFSSKPDLFDRRWIKWTLFVLMPALVFVLVSAGIRVSQYGIDHTILVFGDRTVVAGRETALRISLLADDGRFFLPEHLTVRLARKETQHVVFDDAVSDRGAALGVNFELPALPEGSYELQLDVRFDNKRRIVRAPIQVTAAPPDELLTIPEDATEVGTFPVLVKDGIEIRLFEDDRGTPTGLASTIYIQTLDKDGRPASAPLAMVLPWRGAEILERETDKLGLFAMTLSPPALDARIQVKGAHYKSSSPSVEPPQNTHPLTASTPEIEDAGVQSEAPPKVLAPKLIYTGISALVTEPISSLGNPVEVIVEQISNGGAVYADLYHDGRLVQASSGWISGNRAKIQIKPKKSGLYRLQLYTTPIDPGNAVAVRHFYVTNGDENAVFALRLLLQKCAAQESDRPWAEAMEALPLEQGGYEVQKAAAFLLARLYRGHRHPESLVSSRREDDAELGAFKGEFQRMIMIAVIALGLGVSCFVGLCALAAHRRQQQMTRMILSDGEDGLFPNSEGKGSGRMVLQVLILLLIVLGAFVSIAVLVDTMTWMQH